jgi:urea-proton symporter
MKVLTPADVSAGLVAPAVASALLGKSGATVLLVVLFLAVTSQYYDLQLIHISEPFLAYFVLTGAVSAELIAVSSVLTYDVYKVSLTSKVLMLF